MCELIRKAVTIVVHGLCEELWENKALRKEKIRILCALDCNQARKRERGKESIVIKHCCTHTCGMCYLATNPSLIPLLVAEIFYYTFQTFGKDRILACGRMVQCLCTH